MGGRRGLSFSIGTAGLGRASLGNDSNPANGFRGNVKARGPREVDGAETGSLSSATCAP